MATATQRLGLPRGILNNIADSVGVIEVSDRKELQSWLTESPVPGVIQYTFGDGHSNAVDMYRHTFNLHIPEDFQRILDLAQNLLQSGDGRAKTKPNMTLKLAIGIVLAGVYPAHDLIHLVLANAAPLVEALHFNFVCLTAQNAIECAQLFKHCTSLDLMLVEPSSDVLVNLSELFSVLSNAKKLVRLRVENMAEGLSGHYVNSCKGLRELSRLKELRYLEIEFHVGYHATQDLVHLLDKSQKLKHLTVRLSEMESICLFTNHLETNKTLESLDCEFDSPTDSNVCQGKQLFLHAMYKNSTLKVLRLMGPYGKGSCFGDCIATMIRSNNTLTHCNLGEVNLTLEEATLVATALSENRSLQLLEVGSDEVETKDVERMEIAIKKHGLQVNAKIKEGTEFSVVDTSYFPYFVLQVN